jgi:cytochrome c-type biogenesis protein CcmH
MTAFWSLAVCLLLVALLAVVRHLIAAHQVHNDGAVKPALAIYKQRLLELEQEQEAGLITDEQLQTVKMEIERNLLDEMHAQDGAPAAATRIPPDWKTAVAVLIAIPVLALGLYFQIGQPGIIEALRMTAPHGSADEQLASIEQMVDKLARRLQGQPEDREGWTMLARSYKVLGRFAEAAAAYEHVLSLTGDDPDVLLQYADAMATANGNRLSGRPAELVHRALALSPDNSMGLWLAGMAAREQGDHNTALNYWERLLPQLQNDPDSYQEVSQLIRGARQELGLAAVTEPQTPAAGSDKRIRVRVTLAEDLAGRISPAATLFVYARATSGPPMPLAAARKQARDLPLELVLDDSMAMMPELRMSGFDRVQVHARISKSGTPTESSGDLVATAVPATPGQEQPVELVISSVVP